MRSTATLATFATTRLPAGGVPVLMTKTTKTV
ncbi:MAG: hypothetical protein JWP99_79 [Devosia sp.]|nr:hypothetical protein [Devosia sp.]